LPRPGQNLWQLARRSRKDVSSRGLQAQDCKASWDQTVTLAQWSRLIHDLRLPQLLHCSLGTHWRIINLLKSVRPRLRSQDGMISICSGNRRQSSSSNPGFARDAGCLVRCGAKMKAFREDANPLQSAPQKSARLVLSPGFDRPVRSKDASWFARQNPCLVRDARWRMPIAT